MNLSVPESDPERRQPTNPGSDPDEDLVQRAASGDANAFRQIFHRHRRYVLTLVIRTTGHSEDAEDLVQECFFQMHRALPSFSGRARFRTWFHGIIVNVCHSHTRNRLALRRRTSHHTTSLDQKDFERMADQSGEDGHRLWVMRDWLSGCLARLALLHRVPLVLHFLAGLDLSEIARILGIPEGSVKSRLFHARRKMAVCLKEHGR